MTPPSRIAFCGLLSLLQPLVLAGGYYYKSLALSPRHELESLLSNTSSVFDRSDPRWENATERYQDYAPPQVQLVVQPGVESDIPKIVQYANNHSTEFFLVNRGHALTFSVGEFSGIQIDVRNLRDVTIQPDKKTVRLQAGAYNHEVVSTLWEKGYVVTTGACSCIGTIGPGLGGGHGLYQGKYGLISDNIVNMNVVLANGTTVKVNENTNTDLWWAMRGAGHNFGIVTSYDLKIHPVEAETWYYKKYFFKGDQLEPLFERLNEFQQNGTSPNKLQGADFGIYTMNTSVSETEATISWTFVYAAPQSDVEPLLVPFDQLDAAVKQDATFHYPELFDVLGGGLTSELCKPNRTHIVTTAGLQVYNATTQRQIYDLFNRKVAQHPELGTTRLMHEGYSVEGVRNVNPDQSAFPLRDDYLLMYARPLSSEEVLNNTDIYHLCRSFDGTPKTDSGLEDFTKQWAQETRDLWNAGQPERLPTTYLNYAFGDESLESMYGHEPWRLEKLRALKAQYDPHNRFAYYNPIVPLDKK